MGEDALQSVRVHEEEHPLAVASEAVDSFARHTPEDSPCSVEVEMDRFRPSASGPLLPLHSVRSASIDGTTETVRTVQSKSRSSSSTNLGREVARLHRIYDCSGRRS